MTSEQFKAFRKSNEWKFLHAYITERIEGHRDMLEYPEGHEQRRGESGDYIRGLIAECRMLIAAVEDDQLLLADLEASETKSPL